MSNLYLFLTKKRTNTNTNKKVNTRIRVHPNSYINNTHSPTMKSYYLQSLLFVIAILQFLSGASGRIGSNILERNKQDSAIPPNEQFIATTEITAVDHDQLEKRHMKFTDCDTTLDGIKPGINCTRFDDSKCEGYDCEEVWIGASVAVILILVLCIICCIIMKVAVKIIVAGVVASIIISISMISAGVA
mmetsp:Transcript_1348/g.2131  ORF Transcript_1348/g.2131 Transcript_1348/m.2131 type:complete len:189 (+) Transcript_1348:180-746(+)